MQCDLMLLILGSQYTMDVSALQRMLLDDIGTGRTPLIVIADAGTPITGHVDNIIRIKELCKTNDVWLHLRGHSLAALALPNHQKNGHVSILTFFSLCLLTDISFFTKHMAILMVYQRQKCLGKIS